MHYEPIPLWISILSLIAGVGMIYAMAKWRWFMEWTCHVEKSESKTVSPAEEPKKWAVAGAK